MKLGASKGGEYHMTPYAVIRKLNQLTGSNYPTQMGYNYVRNGLIPATKVAGKWTVKSEDADAWIQKFVTKNGLKVTS
jgi:hypothetical protein